MGLLYNSVKQLCIVYLKCSYMGPIFPHAAFSDARRINALFLWCSCRYRQAFETCHQHVLSTRKSTCQLDFFFANNNGFHPFLTGLVPTSAGSNIVASSPFTL